MPIVAESKSEAEIIDSYTNLRMEDVYFGPLLQLGFTKDDFEINKNAPELHAQIIIKEGHLLSSLILAKTVTINNRTFEKGTIFKITSSWKPTLNEFKSALEKDFIVEKIVNNESMAIAFIKKKD
jgi:hypothetical protein